jgi:lipopolysaccharide assembly outer membrane protein LptD (OstA)
MNNNYSVLAGYKINFGFIILFLFMAKFSFGQEIDLTESVLELPADSTQLDSLSADSTAEKEKFQLQSKIVYDADVVSLSRSKNKIYLFGNAQVKYENMTLTAAKIEVDQNENFLFAEGIVDTVDSLGNPIFKDTPIFTESGEEPMYANNLHYDFKTKRGKIVYGKTQMSPGYYRGQNIFKISDKTLLISDGYFTSCEYIDNPHFYFRSDDMRVVVKDKVIAKPVYFYIADVPLFVIPFGVFPNKKGRRSGILIPSYGESSYGGRFLKDMGYYWAPNDYVDATFLTDFYDKLGFVYDGELNYNLRYILSGHISARYYPVDPNSGKKRERWGFDVRHSHIIDPTLRITASGKFQSDKTYEQELNSNFDSRTNQVITSNLTVSKKFKGTKNSMNMNISRTENLQNGNISYTLPQITFSRSQTSLYETITGSGVKGKRKWYQDIYFSYNSKAIRKGSKTLNTVDSTFTKKISQGIDHRLQFNYNQKVLGVFNLNPSLSYKETWADETTDANLDTASGSIINKQVKGFAARRTFSTSMSLKTTLYGMFEPNIGSLKFIRHKMDPQISYNYTPDFSTPFYGYYKSVIDTAGEEQLIDRFQKSPFGGTSSRESQSLRYSLANLFQAKLVDEKGEESKLDLFNLNFSGSYDFKKDSLNWSDISSSFRTSFTKRLKIQLSARHSLYEAGTRSDKNIFLLDKGKMPRLKSLSGSTGFSLSNKDFTGKSGEDDDEDSEENLEFDSANLDLINDNFDDSIDDDRTSKEFDSQESGKIAIPWQVSLNLNYSYNKSTLSEATERIDLSMNSSINLSKNWKVRWTLRYDWENKQITNQNFDITRDLHCWEMSFSWQPTFNFYRFQINVKESVLQDIKITKQPAGRAYR